MPLAGPDLVVEEQRRQDESRPSRAGITARTLVRRTKRPSAARSVRVHHLQQQPVRTLRAVRVHRRQQHVGVIEVDRVDRGDVDERLDVDRRGPPRCGGLGELRVG